MATNSERLKQIFDMLKPQNAQSVLIFDDKIVQEFKENGYKVKTVYEMCPDSRKIGAVKVQFMRMYVNGHVIEIRVNTEYSISLGANAFIYSIYKENAPQIFLYKAPEKNPIVNKLS